MVQFGRILPFLACLAATAHADPETSPIVDSNYSIELYDGVPLGNSAITGMGGAAMAQAIGTAGTLFNASAPAVKPTTDTDFWSWDYHFDYLNGSLSTDYDNNGFTQEDGTSVLTFGLGARVWEWAIAGTATLQDAPVAATITMPQGEVPLSAQFVRFQLALATWVWPIDTAIGVSFVNDRFAFLPECDGCKPLFEVKGYGAEVGATWAPRGQSFRIGAGLTSPIVGSDATGCDPMDCVGWIVPESIKQAWRVSAGAAYRFADTYWNQLVGGHFRDEKSVTVAADVIVTGSSENSFGLEEFGQHMLQRSGRHTSTSVRGGVEYEWLPGRLRVRGGSYWEPSRFVGVPGRLHATAGIELRVFQFDFIGKPRRGRITVTGDIAQSYRNIGLSIGFWH